MSGGNDVPCEAHENEVEIDPFISLLTQRLEDLTATLANVEAGLSTVLPSDAAIPACTMRVLQTLDYARQSSKDLVTLMGHLEGKVCWSPGIKVMQDDLQRLVDLQDSLSSLSDDKTTPPRDNDLELWA